MTEVWQWSPHPANPAKYVMFDGDENVTVRLQPLPSGYLWQCHKKFGWMPSLEEAKAMAESFSHNRALPYRLRLNIG